MKALVVLSGGLDSAVALSLALKDYDDAEAITFDYGQRHVVEVTAAKKIAWNFEINHTTLRVHLGSAGVLMDHSAEMPHATYEELKEAIGPSPTYVPYRNGTFLSLAASYALVNDCEVIYCGMHAEDAHNWAYPDCTPEFIGAMQNAIYVGTYHKVRLVAPFTYMTKAQIVTLGTRLSTPFGLTHSCYEGKRPACGKCPTCVGRLQAFAIAGVDDPLAYEHDRVQT